MSGERAVWIDGPGGPGSLFAIVHEPARRAEAGLCIIMLNAGQVSRVGPQRLYVKAARAFVRLGSVAIRLDFAGVGDARGENAEIHFDNHSVAEVAAAVRYARNRLKARRVVLVGLCAGARAALKYAAEDANIVGVLAWSCAVFRGGDSAPQPPGDAGGMSAARARHQLGRLGRALRRLQFLSPRWWAKRMVRGGPELRQLGRALKRLVIGGEAGSSEFLEDADDYLRDGRPVLFVYGECDKIPLSEFRERFSGVPEGEGSQALRIVAGGTHTYASIAAQQQVIEISMDWLARHCSVTPS